MALHCVRPTVLWRQELPGKCLASRRTLPLPLKSSMLRSKLLFPVKLRHSRARSVVWQVVASDSQAQDEEEDEDEVFSDEEEELDDDDEDDEEDEIDVDVLSNEEIDALMKEYGSVVRSEPESKKATAEDADADAEALSLAMTLAKVANEVKAVDIKLLHVKPLIYWARYFIIASAFSIPQVNAIAGKMEDVAKEEYDKTPRGSTKATSWTLMDFGDVVVHLFLPSQRDYYNLEEFYANAPVVELPFVSETSRKENTEEAQELQQEEMSLN